MSCATACDLRRRNAAAPYHHSIRGEVQRSINGYLQSDRITRDVDQLIVPPELGTRSGVLGAMALAIAAE